MGNETLTLEGDLPDDEVIAALTTEGSVTSPNRRVPAGASKIKTIIAACAADCAAAGSGIVIIKLGGNAMKDGKQTIVVGALGAIAVQAGADAGAMKHDLLILENVDIDVTAGEMLTVDAELDGDDLGQVQVGATLIFA